MQQVPYSAAMGQIPRSAEPISSCYNTIIDTIRYDTLFALKN